MTGRSTATSSILISYKSFTASFTLSLIMYKIAIKPKTGKETKVIVIGPPLMMRNAVNELMQYNVKEENICVLISPEKRVNNGLSIG